MEPEDEARRRLTFRKQVLSRLDAHEHAEAHAREAEVLLEKQTDDPQMVRIGMGTCHALLAIYYQREGEAL